MGDPAKKPFDYAKARADFDNPQSALYSRPAEVINAVEERLIAYERQKRHHGRHRRPAERRGVPAAGAGRACCARRSASARGTAAPAQDPGMWEQVASWLSPPQQRNTGTTAPFQEGSVPSDTRAAQRGFGAPLVDDVANAERIAARARHCEPATRWPPMARLTTPPCGRSQAPRAPNARQAGASTRRSWTKSSSARRSTRTSCAASRPRTRPRARNPRSRQASLRASARLRSALLPPRSSGPLGRLQRAYRGRNSRLVTRSREQSWAAPLVGRGSGGRADAGRRHGRWNGRSGRLCG